MKRRNTATDLAMIAIMAAVTAALSLVPPIFIGSPVPITAQSMGPMLTGAILGSRRGAISQTLFTALIAIGLPVLAGGRGGFQMLVGVTAAYIWAWILVAALVGLVSDRMRGKYNLWVGMAANIVFGIIVLYLIGSIGVALNTGSDYGKALIGNLQFVPGDVLKAVLAAVIAKGVHTAMPDLLQPAKRKSEAEAASTTGGSHAVAPDESR